MSAFDSLFGKTKTDSSVDELLSKGAGPIARQDLKPRTVVEVPQEEPKPVSTKKSSSAKPKKRKREEEDDDLESKHLSKLTDLKSSDDVVEETKEESDESQESKESALDAPKKSKKARTADLKEEELEKAERTVFVGNVSSKVITEKTIYKEFKALFQKVGPVESIRFRSISFAGPLSRKNAFRKKALHDSRDTVNAYVVFKEKGPSMAAAGALNATSFDDHHIRVDHVVHPSPKDNKRTIFVGNLDFEEQEERLWRFFNSKVDNDVEAVRLVRDSATNMGKGFALVSFKDTLSVNKALLLNGSLLDEDDKKKGRSLRIMRAMSHKPSMNSPNHIGNKRKPSKQRSKFSDEQRTKLGRAQKHLGKADRSTAGRMVIEGSRAQKGQAIAGIKGLKTAKGKVKKPRITQRSSQFKSDKKKFENLSK